MMRAAVFVGLLIVFGAQAEMDDVSPVEKVVTMMEDLQTQVVMEGRAEAKTYDKFACFCKDTSEEKTWDIEDATDLATELTAKIGELMADREEADKVIAEHSAIIEEREKAIKEATDTRRVQHEAFQKE